MKPNAQEVVEDGLYFIPRQTIHPDPGQPRVHPDDELQASIDQQGIITPIIVRPHPEIENEWMIVDGERRWIGARVSAEIPCRIRLDLEDPADRLITQLSANTGKPLSPIEQARAFKKILDESESLSQAELAKRLGIARSTIGDRIRLIEIHPAWMKLIESGHLQVSHAPFIHQYRAVPAEYQVKAAQSVSETDEDYLIRVADMRKALYRAFRDYVIRLDKVSSYKGPVLEIEEETWSSGGTRLKKVKYAADIKLWRPIRNAAERRRKKEQRTSGGSSPSFAPRTRPIDVAMKLIGDRVKVRKTTSWEVKPGPGEIEIFGSDGWTTGVDPEVLSEQLGAEDLVIRESDSGATKKIFTTNSRAVELAQQSFDQKLLSELTPNLKKIRAKLTPELLAANAITGPGVRAICASMLLGDSYENENAKVASAVALGLVGRALPDTDDFGWDSCIADVVKALAGFSDATIEMILSGLAAALTLKEGLPDLDEQREAIAGQTAKTKFSFRDAEPPKSKKQQKREARAAGKQVGDPARAKSVEPKCIHCGCTEDAACEGGCAWATTDPYVCTACAEAFEDAKQRHEIDDEAEELEEVEA